MSRRVVLLILVISFWFAVVGCREQVEENDEEMIEMREVNEKVWYSDLMYFERTAFTRGLPNLPANYFSEVVFVHTEEEASRFSDDILVGMSDVIVVWPTVRTQLIVENMNEYIEKNGIDLERFSLIYPLTIECLVDNWEKVFDLYENGISRSGQVSVLGVGW